MAISERWMRENYGTEKIDHRIYAICGDGDLSEGISHEAASLAGQQKLGRLICIYDDNHITIDGPTELSLQDDAAKRFESYGWQVIDIGESAEDLDAIEDALQRARENEDAPSLVIIRSHIGYPSPTLSDTPDAHGYAFKDEEIADVKSIMDLPEDEPFYVPQEVIDFYRNAGRKYEAEASMSDWSPDSELGSWDLDSVQELYESQVGESVATRVASGVCLNQISSDLAIIAGGADLTGNTGTAIKNSLPLSPAYPAGKQLFYGVREHAMGAIMNGIALHGGIVPVGGTFLVFSDYMRPAIRLAALSQAKVIYSFTHDSVGVGEDGPTHQPVEQIMSLRAIPGLTVIRPADAKETVAAWITALNNDGPTALILSRQNLPILKETNVEMSQQGIYTLIDHDSPEATLIATGSEVSLCVQFAEEKPVRVISMPSWDLDGSKEFIIDASIPTVSVEAGITLGWAQYATKHVGIDRFGSSAPGNEVMHNLGINLQSIQEAISE